MHTHGERKGQDILKKSDAHRDNVLRQHEDGHLQQPLAVQLCAKITWITHDRQTVTTKSLSPCSSAQKREWITNLRVWMDSDAWEIEGDRFACRRRGCRGSAARMRCTESRRGARCRRCRRDGTRAGQRGLLL